MDSRQEDTVEMLIPFIFDYTVVPEHYNNTKAVRILVYVQTHTHTYKCTKTHVHIQDTVRTLQLEKSYM